MIYVVSSITIERNALIDSGKEAYVWERLSHRALTGVPIQAIARQYYRYYHKFPRLDESGLLDLWWTSG
jgi:hypothetical protein